MRRLSARIVSVALAALFVFAGAAPCLCGGPAAKETSGGHCGPAETHPPGVSAGETSCDCACMTAAPLDAARLVELAFASGPAPSGWAFAPGGAPLVTRPIPATPDAPPSSPPLILRI